MTHPIRDPRMDKIDYIRNMVFGQCKIAMLMLLDEGANIPETANVSMQLQGAVARAFHEAVADASEDEGIADPEPPDFNSGMGGDPSDPEDPFDT